MHHWFHNLRERERVRVSVSVRLKFILNVSSIMLKGSEKLAEKIAAVGLL